MIFDFLVIGDGMAGASSAYELTESARVLLVEAERRVGSHLTKKTSGPAPRNYGPPVAKQINAIGTRMDRLMMFPEDAFLFKSMDAWPHHLKIQCSTPTDVTPIKHGGTVPWSRGAIPSQDRVAGKAQRSKYLRGTDAKNFT